jgi:hypothetical protein
LRYLPNTPQFFGDVGGYLLRQEAEAQAQPKIRQGKAKQGEEIFDLFGEQLFD